MPPRARPQPFAPSAAAPSYLTSLIGRDRELAELAELIRGHRLVSLVGVGGSGKTRLAAALAILVEEIDEVRYISATDATTRWGTGHAAGVIQVRANY